MQLACTKLQLHPVKNLRWRVKDRRRAHQQPNDWWKRQLLPKRVLGSVNWSLHGILGISYAKHSSVWNDPGTKEHLYAEHSGHRNQPLVRHNLRAVTTSILRHHRRYHRSSGNRRCGHAHAKKETRSASHVQRHWNNRPTITTTVKTVTRQPRKADANPSSSLDVNPPFFHPLPLPSRTRASWVIHCSSGLRTSHLSSNWADESMGIWEAVSC